MRYLSLDEFYRPVLDTEDDLNMFQGVYTCTDYDLEPVDPKPANRSRSNLLLLDCPNPDLCQLSASASGARALILLYFEKPEAKSKESIVLEEIRLRGTYKDVVFAKRSHLVERVHSRAMSHIISPNWYRRTFIRCTNRIGENIIFSRARQQGLLELGLELRQDQNLRQKLEHHTNANVEKTIIRAGAFDESLPPCGRDPGDRKGDRRDFGLLD